MKHFIESYLLWLKQQICSPKNWILLILLPAAMMAAVLLLPEEESAAPVQVGVCLPDKGAEELWELLKDRSEAVITFRLADEETICAKVATGQWDCGIVVDPEFEKYLEELDTDGLVRLYTGPASVTDPLVQETVSAVFMQLVGPRIAEEYARKAGIGELGAVEELAQSQRVQITMRSLSGSQLQVQALAQRSTKGLLLGCAALVLLIWCVFCAIDLGDWRRSNQVRRMCMVRSPAAILMPRAAAVLMPALVAGVCCVCILGVPVEGFIALAGYMTLLWAAALLLSGWGMLLDALPVLMPFVAVLALILSPAVFDIGTYFPMLAPICDTLPMSLLLRAAQGDWMCAAILWTEAVGVTVLFFLSETIMKKVR